jgi:hypothetical protein
MTLRRRTEAVRTDQAAVVVDDARKTAFRMSPTGISLCVPIRIKRTIDVERRRVL